MRGLFLKPIEPLVETLDHVQDALKPWIRRALWAGVAIPTFFNADFKAFLWDAAFVWAFHSTCSGSTIGTSATLDADFFAGAAASSWSARAGAFDNAFTDLGETLPNAFAEGAAHLVQHLATALKHLGAARGDHRARSASHAATTHAAAAHSAEGAALGSVMRPVLWSGLSTATVTALWSAAMALHAALHLASLVASLGFTLVLSRRRLAALGALASAEPLACLELLFELFDALEEALHIGAALAPGTIVHRTTAAATFGATRAAGTSATAWLATTLGTLSHAAFATTRAVFGLLLVGELKPHLKI